MIERTSDKVAPLGRGVTAGEPPRPAIRLGVLTPSSNTVLEPMATAILQSLPDVTAHYARFRVRQITLGEETSSQFTLDPILAAAEQLADARVQAIIWSGTSASWLGFKTDLELCAAVSARTGIPCGTSVLALNAAFHAAGVRRFGLVTPYLDDVQARIVANYAASGFECVAERHLGDAGNFSFATYDEPTIASMVRDVATSRPEAIAVLCTNFRGTRIAAALEAELGLPVYDSIATALWQGLNLAGVDPSRVMGWGSLFKLKHGPRD